MSEPRTALVVDDEDQLLRLMARVIERRGDRVLVASTADEARALFRKHAAVIQIAVLDVTMPGGDGAEALLPELLDLCPMLEVIVMSGDAMPPGLAAQIEQIGGRFLRKPFLPKTLMAMLEEPGGRSPSAAPGPPSGPGST